MILSIASLPLPIRLRPGTPVTDRGLMIFGEENSAWRIEREPNGELVLMTPAGSKTSLINRRIVASLGDWTDQDGRGVAFESSAGFALPDGSVRSPDASWLGKERWSALSDEEQEGYAPVCPQFVIELRSPTDSLAALRTKMTQWLANGSELAWLIDPQRKVVEVYRSGQDPEVHEDPSSVQGTGCVAGFELVMQRVWI